MADTYNYGVGRRKEATATARLTAGNGTIVVNGKPYEEYFAHPEQNAKVVQPLKLIDKLKDHNVSLLVKGGGLAGQADACRLAVAKSINDMSLELRPTLKKAGLLKRDARVKERKKFGLKRARKASQFTKR